MINYIELEKRAEKILSEMTLTEMMRQISVFTPDNSNKRLGIPHINAGEACHGVCVEGATSFPQAISLGATFNPELVEEVGKAVAREARAFGMHMVFTPMMALARDARWGRVEESYGEDPELVSEIGCAHIAGLQGMGDEQFNEEHVLCVAKHFIADGEPSKGINGAPVDISEESLRELHMQPFERAVKKIGLGGIMPAHHSLNRVPCHCNKWLLTDVLRGEWGFNGVVVSDMLDIPKVYSYGGDADDRDHHQHRVAQSSVEASWMALRAGVDVELGGYLTDFANRSYGQELYNGIISGRFPEGEKYLRRAAKNIIIAKLKLGLFDWQSESAESNAYESKHYEDTGEGEYFAVAMKKGERLPGAELLKLPEEVSGVDFESHATLAEHVAEESAILLKNDGLLPLDAKTYKHIAVIGQNAVDCLLGGYSTSRPRHYVSVLDGIKGIAAADATVTYSRGCIISKDDNEYGSDWESRRDEYIADIPEAVAAAKAADVAILVLGHNRKICGENTDADEICLTWAQRQLIRAIHKTGTPIALVIIGGRPTSIPWESENLPAIMQCFYLGQETGTAVAKILFGEVNPSGKLPMAIPRRASHIPVLYNALYWGSPKEYIGSAMPCTPLYPFGYGLSYTSFQIGKPSIDKAEMTCSEKAVVSISVKNIGDRAGAEVVQLYIRDDFGSIVRPMRELKHFQKVMLQPSEEKIITFEIGFDELKFFKDNEWVVESGYFSIYVGNDSTCTEKIMLKVN